MSIASRPVTTEELLAMPDDGVRREIIRGELREEDMSTRSGPHGIVASDLAYLLGVWLRLQPLTRGRVYTGEARIRLRRELDTFVGADLVYLSPEQAARITFNAPFIDEPPTLVVEILSPSDTIEGVNEKIDEYLKAGVPLLWIVDPVRRTIVAYRPDEDAVLFTASQTLTAEPHLPGFRAAVADVFEA